MTEANLSEDVSCNLQSLGHVMKIFKELKQMPLPTSAVAMFCAIATQEGLSVVKYARVVNSEFNAAGKAIADLSDIDRYGSQGLGLVQKRQGEDGRVMLCFLTPKGRAFAGRVAAAMDRQPVKLAA
jgi:hypothetical protein